DIAVNPDLDAALPLALAPSKAYRELMYRPEGQVSRLIEDRFDVLARPGQRLSERPQEGDILLQVSLGRPGAGERAVLLTAGLTRQRANGGGSAAGWYAPTTAILDPSGEVPRRILDPF